MAAYEWRNVYGVEFDGDAAREASDFGEIVEFHALTPEEAYDMFSEDAMGVGKRLYFAKHMCVDKATLLLLLDPDDRVRRVVEARLKEYRDANEGI